MLLVREAGEDLSRLDVFQNGRALLDQIREGQEPTKRSVQRYLDRLKETDFANYTATQKREVADAVNRLANEGGLVLLCREASSEYGWKRITNVRCNVSNERSKGTFRVSSGRDPVITRTPRSHFPELRAVAQGEYEAAEASSNPKT